MNSNKIENQGNPFANTSVEETLEQARVLYDSELSTTWAEKAQSIKTETSKKSADKSR